MTLTREYISKHTPLLYFYDSIGVQLIRLFGGNREMRPVLESLFHRMLLVPPANSRGDILKATHELLRSNELVVKLICPPTMSSENNGSSAARKSADLDLLRM